MQSVIFNYVNTGAYVKQVILIAVVPNGKLIIFRCPKVWTHNSLIIMCLNTGTSENYHFPFGINGKIVVLGVPIL